MFKSTNSNTGTSTKKNAGLFESVAVPSKVNAKIMIVQIFITKNQ